MKTFEVYSLNDPTYRGRVLVAAVQADRFTIQGNEVTFYKDTFFSTRQTSGIVFIDRAFAVLDTEFSTSIEKPKLGDLGWSVELNGDTASANEEAT